MPVWEPKRGCGCTRIPRSLNLKNISTFKTNGKHKQMLNPQFMVYILYSKLEYYPMDRKTEQTLSLFFLESQLHKLELIKFYLPIIIFLQILLTASTTAMTTRMIISSACELMVNPSFIIYYIHYLCKR